MRRPSLPKALIGAFAGVLMIAACALAYWSSQGSGSASGKVGTLNPATGLSASTPTGSSSVSVSWSAAEPAGGLSPAGYYLKRWSSGAAAVAGGTCGTPSEPVNQTSCTDTGVADGTYTYTVVAVYRSWTAESSHSSSVTVLLDTTPPSTTIALSPETADGSGGWYKTVPTFTLSASDAGTGVASTKYQIDGGATQAYTGSPVSVAEGSHTVSYWSIDRAGNAETPKSRTIKVDTVAPTSAISMGGSPSHALLSGGTLYFNSATSGSFTLIDTAADATSGAASATFPLVSATNWTHAAQTVTTPSGGPYSSSTYSWTSGAGTPSGGQASFTSADAAGNTSAAIVLSFMPDTTPPSGGALSVNGTAATAAGSVSTSTSTSFAIGARTDYSEAQSATQSGLASSTLTIQSETLSAGACGAPGSGGAYTTATTITGTSNPAVATGFCYLYTLTGTDNVGNAAAVETTVKLDTTPPSAPAVSLSSATGSTFISGTTAYINAQAGREGSFKATASSSDPESGVASIALPSLTGFASGGGTLASPFETTYKWSGAAGAAGAQSATATNGLGLTATNASAFTVTPDTTGPSTAGTVSVPARVHSTSVSVTFGGASDAGSGIGTAAGELLRAEAAYAVGSDTCGSFGSFAKVGSSGPTSPVTDSTVANNKCYEYEYKASDNVGNTTTSAASGSVKVDTTAPKASSITATNGVGATAHKVDAKDAIAYTFTENVDPGTIAPAWSTASTPDQTVTVTFKDSNEGNGTNKPDSFEVTTAGVHLGAVEMSSGFWVPIKGGSYSFSSTMHFSTVEEKAGEQRSRVTITLNSLNSGGSTVGSESGSDTFKWTPSGSITDLAGNPADTTTKAESKAEHF